MQKDHMPSRWTQEHEKMFGRIKALVTSAPVLGYIDPAKPTEAQGDGSDKGLGFILMQNGLPVTYTSHAMSNPELD